MFNKIMVVADHDVKLTDYLALARIISMRVDPVEDIHFLRGPVDILDHSSSQYAYGSKMGIDATRKLPQGPQSTDTSNFPDGGCARGEVQTASILQAFPEIRQIRSDLLNQGISLLIIAVKKSRKQQIWNIAAELLTRKLVEHVKFMLFVDDLLDIASLSQVAWISANNIDPIRDSFYIDREHDIKFPTLCIDATRKSLDFDNFKRDWPNVTVMDDKTIEAVDQKWNSLNIGPLVTSPSVVFKVLNINTGAISRENY
jgi:4-hydroxy-3-polyprenylbenzoate decarboxylase